MCSHKMGHITLSFHLLDDLQIIEFVLVRANLSKIAATQSQRAVHGPQWFLEHIYTSRHLSELSLPPLATHSRPGCAEWRLIAPSAVLLAFLQSHPPFEDGDRVLRSFDRSDGLAEALMDSFILLLWLVAVGMFANVRDGSSVFLRRRSSLH
jgi:hypothetical protein